MQSVIIPDISGVVNVNQDISAVDIFDRQTYCICGNPLPLPLAKGHPFKYCSDSCRKLARSLYITGRNGHKWTTKQRQEILERDNHICVYCGEPTIGIDHVMPVEQGGIWEPNNAVACCRECNSHKSARIDERGIAHLRKVGADLSWMKVIIGIVKYDNSLVYAVTPNTHTKRYFFPRAKQSSPTKE